MTTQASMAIKALNSIIPCGIRHKFKLNENDNNYTLEGNVSYKMAEAIVDSLNQLPTSRKEIKLDSHFDRHTKNTYGKVSIPREIAENPSFMHEIEHGKISMDDREVSVKEAVNAANFRGNTTSRGF